MSSALGTRSRRTCRCDTETSPFQEALSLAPYLQDTAELDLDLIQPGVAERCESGTTFSLSQARCEANKLAFTSSLPFNTTAILVLPDAYARMVHPKGTNDA